MNKTDTTSPVTPEDDISPVANGGPRICVVSGARSGIGAATSALLRRRGWTVIGIDLSDTDIAADLSHPEGRRDAAAAVTRLCPDGISALIACAGIVAATPAVAVNYFGATELAQHLRPLLARGHAPRAVLVSSLAATFPVDAGVVEACLAGDEPAALARAETCQGETISLLYASSKQALSLWTRRNAITADWAGTGILLNAVAPGSVLTQMTLPVLATTGGRAFLHKTTPIATGDFATPAMIAPLLAFLAGPENGYMVGQTVFVDGGSDAILRPDHL